MANYPVTLYSLLFLLSFSSFADGPVSYTMSVADKEWPLPITSDDGFDVASKCEMLVFIEVLNRYDSYTETVLSTKVKVKDIKMQSVKKWKTQTKERILANFGKLSDTSLDDVIAIKKNSSWESLSSISLRQTLPPDFLNWYHETALFYADYINEQIRLAALYPKVTSEILQFSTNEIQGHDFPDKHFLLSFDDGPTTIGGPTDELISVLDRYGLKGMFFVLGDNLEKRLNASSAQAVRNLYGENKVFSHGRIHRSHQHYAYWRASIDDTNQLLQRIFPVKDSDRLLYFRPPYGQRSQLLVDYFAERNAKIILWNIDSRDWSSALSTAQVARRQVKLMLLWRKGILLFHDIHRKAQKALPIIYDYFKGAGITWSRPDTI